MNNLDVTPPQIRAVAFDLDGTIYLGNTVVDGAVELVRDLRSAGRDVFFFTNSSTRSRVQVLEKLAKMGLEPRLDHIYTSAYAAAVYLATQAVSSVFCLGTAGLKEELAGNGIEVTSDPFKAEALLVGLDPDFSYGKLAEVMALPPPLAQLWRATGTVAIQSKMAVCYQDAVPGSLRSRRFWGGLSISWPASRRPT